MNTVLNEINEVLSNDVVDRHSFFQLRSFILGKEYTVQGKMWQCLREIKTRKSSIESYLIEIEETKDRIELLHIEKDRLYTVKRFENSDKFTTKEIEVKSRMLDRKINALKNSIESLESKIKDYEDESKFFIAEFKYMNESEPVKSLDDLDAQKEYWTAKLHQEVNLKMLLQQPLDVELVKTVLALNDDSPLKQSVLRLLDSTHKAIQNAAKKQPKE